MSKNYQKQVVKSDGQSLQILEFLGTEYKIRMHTNTKEITHSIESMSK